MQDNIYWSGNNFELNIAFGTLRDYQWKRLLDTLWAHQPIEGPLQHRYIPGEQHPAMTSIQYPKPTDTFTQHGVLGGDGGAIGIDILVTRSLFECISISAPTGMFVVNPEQSTPDALRTDELKIYDTYRVYQDIALHLHQTVNFEIASIGWNRECQILTELIEDSEKRAIFFEHGNFFATDQSLEKLGEAPEDYEIVGDGVRWAPPRR